MSNEKELLQKGLFDNSDEKLMSVIKVINKGKVSKKKEDYYLALSINNNPPFLPKISSIKVGEKLKMKRMDMDLLEELSVCDAKLNIESKEFECSYNDGHSMVYNAVSFGEKRDFVDSLWDYCQRYLPAMPVFKNFTNKAILHPQSSANEQLQAKLLLSEQQDLDHVNTNNKQVSPESTSKKNIMVEDEEWLLEILTKYHCQISNFVEFTDTLTESLDDIKWGNLETIMMSQHNCIQVMDKLDDMIQCVDSMYQIFDRYDSELLDLRNQIKELEMVDSDRELRVHNQKSLLEALDKYVTCLDVPDEIMQYAQKNNYDENIEKTMAALHSFVRVFQVKIPDVVKSIPHFKSQYNLVSSCASSFVQNITINLVQKIKNYASDAENSVVSKDIAMTNHFKLHRSLKLFSPVIALVRLIHASQFSELYTCYCVSFSRLYEKQIEGLTGVVLQKINSLQALQPSLTHNTTPTKVNKECALFVRLDENNLNAINDFKSYFDKYFDLLESALTKEIKFCNEFFSLNVNPNAAHTSNGNIIVTDEDENALRTQEYASSKLGLLLMKSILSQEFGFLEETIKNFLDTILKRAPVLHIYIANRLYFLIKSLSNPEYTFLLNLYQIWFDLVLDKLNEIFKLYYASIEDSSKPSKAKRPQPIISVVNHFEDFITVAEQILPENVDLRCPQLEQIYKEFHQITIISIENYSSENENSLKQEAVRVENLLNLSDFCQKIKGPWILFLRKETKTHYEAALNRFINAGTNEFLKPIFNYFHAIEVSIKRGVKNSEISIQSAHSVVQLNKIIGQFTYKDMKKIIETIARQISKCFFDDNLRVILWTRTHGLIIESFKKIFNLYNDCYPEHSPIWDLNSDNINNILSSIDVSNF